MKSIISTLFLFILVLPVPAAAAGNTAQTDHYRVVDGKVDPDTLIGYNVFHQVCVGCHGVGGVGMEPNPDLTRSMERLSAELFRIKVLHKFAVRFSTDDWKDMEQSMLEEIRKQEKRDRGELITMPHWENNPMVTNNVYRVYRYLKARADGVIGPDKPGLLKD